MYRRSAWLVLLALVIGFSATSFAQDKLRPRYVLPGVAIFPEGVAYNPATGDFFVSSTSDGTIYRGNIARGLAAPFLAGRADGRTAATGLKVDSAGRLYVSGGATGQIFVYDTNTRKLLAQYDNNIEATFINDVALTPDGTAYFTDSQQAVLYAVSRNANDFVLNTYPLAPPFNLAQGFNVNGIAATPDGRYLIIVQSNTGKLFRVDVAKLVQRETNASAVTEINLGGQTVTAGDGILLVGQTLYVVRNRLELIVPVAMSADFASGTVAEGFTSELFQYPTTIAQVGNSLLVVNSQFDKRGGDLRPEYPFNVATVPIP